MADPSTYRPRPGEIPVDPGVYRFRDAHGRVIYVGKAKSLRSRLSLVLPGHLGAAPAHPRRWSPPAPASSGPSSRTEVEALQLEYSWIKEFDPRFNVKYRDDKSYPYLAVTMGEEFPRAQVMRGAKRKGTRYFGPYAHAWAIRETARPAAAGLPGAHLQHRGVQAGRPGRPPVPARLHRQVLGALRRPGRRRASTARSPRTSATSWPGRHQRFVTRLERQMQAAVGRARLRAGRPAARRHRRAQPGAGEATPSCCADGTDADVFALAEDELEAAVQVFHVRDGRVRGQRGWVVEKVERRDHRRPGRAPAAAGLRRARPATPCRARCSSRRCPPTPSRCRRLAERPARRAGSTVRVPAARRQARPDGDRAPQRRAGAGPAQGRAGPAT